MLQVVLTENFFEDIENKYSRLFPNNSNTRMLYFLLFPKQITFGIPSFFKKMSLYASDSNRLLRSLFNS